MVTIVLVLISLMALLLLYAVRGKTSPIAGLDDLVGRTRPVDIDAFRNLIDPAEEEFLRENLPAGEFRAVQRERLRAAVEYVSCAAHNAAILVRLGESARLNLDPKISEAGQQLLDSGFAPPALCSSRNRQTVPGDRVARHSPLCRQIGG